jgi:hypothetical protein
VDIPNTPSAPAPIAAAQHLKMDATPIPPRGQSLKPPETKGRSSSVGNVAPQLLEQLIRDATEAMGSVTRQFKANSPKNPKKSVAPSSQTTPSSPTEPIPEGLVPLDEKNFRRSYSTSSIRMMTRAEVGPSDFIKLKLLGKGDVGKVYMVVRLLKKN